VTPELHSWLAPLQALALVVNLRARLRHCELVGDVVVFGAVIFVITCDPKETVLEISLGKIILVLTFYIT
jgi:hypothetical protein